METKSTHTPAAVVDLGKQTKKRIKKLRQGEGPLPVELEAAIREATLRLGSDKTIVPVVILYEKKPKRRLSGLPFLGSF